MKALGISILSVVGAMAFGLSEWEAFVGLAKPPRSQPIVRESRPVRGEKGDESDVASKSRDVVGEDPTACTETMRRKVAILERGQSFLEEVGGYTAVLQKQELVGGDLHDEESILVKCRHHPLSVYLNWQTGDPGREVLFVEGQNNGKMIAHDGGWKSRLPTFTLNTEGSLAMRDTRYPVTSAGLLGLLKMMRSIHQNDLDKSNFKICESQADQRFDGRSCVVFTTIYRSSHQSPIYRKSVTYIDEQWNIPVYTCHFEWPSQSLSTDALNDEELDQKTLIESYSFTDVRFRNDLTDFDFDRTNPEFHFR